MKPIRSEPATRSTSNYHRGLSVLILLTLTTLINACSTTMTMGKVPLTERLDQLTIDVSTMSEVRAILGEPQGRGAVKSPSFGLKEAWLYESSEMKGMGMTMEIRGFEINM